MLSGAVRWGLTVGSAGSAAAVLSGCRPSHPKKAAPSRLSGRVQILIGFDGGNEAAQRQVQQALGEAFIAAHPHVGVDFLRATSPAAATSQLLALLERGAPPDVVLGVDLAGVSRLLDRKVWLDLHPLINRDGLDVRGFLPEAWAAATVPGYYGAKHGVAGLPLGVHDHALAYNVDLLSRAGVRAPPVSWTQSGWTYTGGFLEAAQRLTVDAGGRHAAQAGFDPGQVVQFGTARIPPEFLVFSFGQRIYDPSRRRATLAQSGVVAGAQFAADLVHRYFVQPTDTQLRQLAPAPSPTPAGGAGVSDLALAAWRAGKLAMIDLCSCELDSGFALNIPFTWRAAALPAGPARRFRSLHVSLASIVAASHQHDLAWEVLKFLALNPAHEAVLAYHGFGTVPAVSAGVPAFVQGVRQAQVDPSEWIAGLPGASVDNDTWIPAFEAVHTALVAGLADIMNGAPASTVMPGVQARAQARIDAWFKSNKLP